MRLYSFWRLARNSACPPSVFSFTQSPQCCKRETFEKFTCIWNIETIRSHLKFQPFLVFSPSRKQSWSKTVVSLLDLKKQASWFAKRISWYMTRNTWELKLNSTILTHSKKQVDVYCIDLDSEFVDLNYIVASLIFCHFWRSISVSWVKLEHHIIHPNCFLFFCFLFFNPFFVRAKLHIFHPVFTFIWLWWCHEWFVV